MGHLRQEKRKIIFLGIFVLVIGILLAGFVEGFVRIRHWYKYGEISRSEEKYFIDVETGLRLPLSHGNVKVNSLGFRNPDVILPKPASTIRIAFLGGSTTFCEEASRNETTWPYLVWKGLQEQFPEKNFDFINAGVPGYKVETSLANLRKRVMALKPDIIFIYHATNDITSNSRILAQEQGLYKGEPVTTSWLGEWSFAWFLAEKNFQVWLRQQGSQNDTDRLVVDPPQLSLKFRNDLIELISFSKTIAPVVGIATFSHNFRREQTKEEQISASNTTLYYMPYMSMNGIFDAFEEYNLVIREVAQQMEVVLIEDEHYIPSGKKYFHDSVHFTDVGSRLMAQRVIEGLRKSPKFSEYIGSL